MSEIQLPASGLAEDILPLYREKRREHHLVTFTLGEEYGVPIHQVQEIIRVSGVTKVPNSPSYMDGVINLRGRVLPVLNLRKRLRLAGKEPSKASRIIVTEVGDTVIGLLVDGVSHVVKMPPESVESPPEEVLEVDTDYITGVGKLKDRLVILLDLERLLKRDALEVGSLTGEGGSHGKED
ncbi:MAG: chemotaxis protein CheW [Nitrospiraceae bacterium]|nr:chemotaxis protein CheW [Nitrospiraceae bacterium]